MPGVLDGLYVPDRSKLSWHGHARVEKFYVDDDVAPVWVDPIGRDLRNAPVWQRKATPYGVVEAENLVLTAGATLVLNRLAGISATAIDATNGRIAVGNGTTSVSAGQTDLQGASKYRQVFDAVPTVSGNQLQAVATVAAGSATFTWEEAGLANASSGATLINRFLQSFGAKGAGTQWILTITVTLS
jgi:hypothetical protein